MAESNSQTDMGDKSQPNGFRKYNIPLEQVPKFPHDDPRVDECISQMVSLCHR